jgi:hypothetical protein
MIVYKDSKALVQWSAYYSIVFETVWETEQEIKCHRDKDNLEVIKVKIEEVIPCEKEKRID